MLTGEAAVDRATAVNNVSDRDGPATPQLSSVGVVVIGRNEGERLGRCLESVKGSAGRVVYVDSGSTDGSVEQGRRAGAEVVQLDMSRPFTAARSRNAGFERLMELEPGLTYVQFVDGDCEVRDGWMERALRELDARSDVAVVCGRRRERFPEATVFNRLCDMEWAGRPGETESCGGDAMMRCEVMKSVGGYDPGLIAGEEPDLCYRIRRAGWKVLRVDCEMTLHDAAMKTMGQWWKRTRRAGHAYAEGAWMHGKGGGFNVRSVARIVGWGIVGPALVLALGVLGAWWWWAWALAALLVVAYVAQAARVSARRVAQGDRWRHAALYGAFCMIGKLPEACGVIEFVARRARGRRTPLIEYK